MQIQPETWVDLRLYLHLAVQGGSVFRGVPGITSRTQQDRGQMSSAFELKLTYVKILSSFQAPALVGTLKGFSRRGTPKKVRAADGLFGGQKHKIIIYSPKQSIRVQLLLRATGNLIK